MDNYAQKLRYFITFLKVRWKNPNFNKIQHKTLMYADAHGLSKDGVVKQCLESLNRSHTIKACPVTAYYIGKEKLPHIFAYAYLVRCRTHVMYAKFAYNDLTRQAFLISWHPSHKPNDPKFKIINLKEGF